MTRTMRCRSGRQDGLNLLLGDAMAAFPRNGRVAALVKSSSWNQTEEIQKIREDTRWSFPLTVLGNADAPAATLSCHQVHTSD